MFRASKRAVAVLGALAIIGLGGAGTQSAWAVGSEHLGSDLFPNRPRYDALRLALVNLPSRVYWRELNADRRFFYRGNTTALNTALKAFAALQIDEKEVVLRPGPGMTQTFAGLNVPYNWEVHMLGGLPLALRQRALAEGVEVFQTRPRMIVLVGGAIDLNAIQVPAGISLLELKDLEQRYLVGLNLPLPVPTTVTDLDVVKTAQADRTLIRGQSARALGDLGVAAENTVGTLVTLLDDPEVYVRDSATDALGALGPLAKDAVPALRRRLQVEPTNHRPETEEALGRIQAPADTARYRQERERLAAIHAFRQRHARR